MNLSYIAGVVVLIIVVYLLLHFLFHVV